MSTPKKAVILVSGGLDSATCLAMAKSQGFECYALSFDYGQRHRIELEAAQQIAEQVGVKAHQIIRCNLNELGGSALTDTQISVPQDALHSSKIPVTYVPARNTIFLSFALAFAEVVGAYTIFIGANAIDYSNYPDCRPDYIEAFQHLANLATKAGVEGHSFHIQAPLLHLNKAEIIQLGTQLGLDYSQSISCYAANPEGKACGHCDSCLLRAKGFKEAGLPDPTHYL